MLMVWEHPCSGHTSWGFSQRNQGVQRFVEGRSSQCPILHHRISTRRQHVFLTFIHIHVRWFCVSSWKCSLTLISNPLESLVEVGIFTATVPFSFSSNLWYVSVEFGLVWSLGRLIITTSLVLSLTGTNESSWCLMVNCYNTIHN